MKNLFIILILLCFTLFGFTQNPQIEIVPNIDEVEVKAPLFTGIKNVVSMNNANPNYLKNYLKTNVIYPEDASKYRNEGTGVVKFVVTANGNVRDVEIVNGVCAAINEEMIRVLETTDGMWKPGLKDGRPVAMNKEVSLVFALSDNRQATAQRFQTKATNYYEKGSVLMLEKRKFKKAEKFYSMGINYLPYDQSLLLLRGLSRYEQGNKDGALEDWTRLKAMGGLGLEPSHLVAEIKHMKGYQELLSLVDEK